MGCSCRSRCSDVDGDGCARWDEVEFVDWIIEVNGVKSVAVGCLSGCEGEESEK